MATQCYTYDFTIHEGHNPCGLDRDWVIEKLKGWCKKWVFQLEKGSKTGRLHFQGRVSLIDKKRLKELIAQIPLKADWSLTCKKVHDGCNFNYVMKEDTRVEGPWKDEDFPDLPKVTKQLTNFMAKELYPWQAQVLEIAQTYDERSIHMIWDEEGNVGKSTFAEFLEYKRIAFELPPMKNIEDIMQFVYGFQDQKCYLVDMPRGMKKDKLGEFYAGIECLKNGVCYDKRYTAKKRRFDRPQIVIFSNVLPDFSLLSNDRWQIWKMLPTKALAAYDWRVTSN